MSRIVDGSLAVLSASTFALMLLGLELASTGSAKVAVLAAATLSFLAQFIVLVAVSEVKK